ncbi:MAG: hypothetical protein CMO81_05515 [Waddliaceae bacterium]|nr:hypothetical protein [Waddliaceae bacterium]
MVSILRTVVSGLQNGLSSLSGGNSTNPGEDTGSDQDDSTVGGETGGNQEEQSSSSTEGSNERKQQELDSYRGRVRSHADKQADYHILSANEKIKRREAERAQRGIMQVQLRPSFVGAIKGETASKSTRSLEEPFRKNQAVRKYQEQQVESNKAKAEKAEKEAKTNNGNSNKNKESVQTEEAA